MFLQRNFKFRFAFMVSLLSSAMMGASKESLAQSKACALVTDLRAMAANHFKAQRKALIDDGEFQTDYLIPGASRCKIRTFEKSSSLSCDWYMKKGLNNQAEVREIFVRFVNEFQACAQDKNGVGIGENRDGRGAVATLEDKSAKIPSGSRLDVSIMYRWFAPWWVINLEYTRYDN